MSQEAGARVRSRGEFHRLGGGIILGWRDQRMEVGTERMERWGNGVLGERIPPSLHRSNLYLGDFMKIKIFPDADAVAQKAAEIIAAEGRSGVKARGCFLVAVSGGHTPWQMLRALADQKLPWKAHDVVEEEQRIAPAGDPDRNLTHLYESLLEHAPV